MGEQLPHYDPPPRTSWPELRDAVLQREAERKAKAERKQRSILGIRELANMLREQWQRGGSGHGG